VTPGWYVLAGLIAFVGAVVAGRLGVVQRSAVVVLPAILVSMMTVTIVTFLADTAATAGWTTSRQAAGSLVGKDACGVASDLVVSTPTGERRSHGAVSSGSRRILSVGATDLHSRRAVKLDRTRSTPWYAVGRGAIGVFVGGHWAPRDRLEVMWGRTNMQRVTELQAGNADLLASTEGPDAARWSFVAESSFPIRPAMANRVRFRLLSSGGSSSPEVTPPTGSISQPLARLIQADKRTLVSPFLFEAMPCATLPSLVYGVADSPDLLVDWVRVPSLTNPSSPWAGLSELLELDRIPVSSEVDRGPIFVYKVRTDPRDAVAPARRSILS
jgi:hypothetical protein